MRLVLDCEVSAYPCENGRKAGGAAAGYCHQQHYLLRMSKPDITFFMITVLTWVQDY